ncbi:hypothetical protein [Priestia megaterium]|uniref:hypothetical protein n=1 Tax=Priestia megaterium TaxID=1404 RepID=UPI003EEEA063
MNSKEKGDDLVHQRIETRKEIRLLDSEIDLCNQIRKLLLERGERYLESKQEYTEYEVLQIALNRLMNELTFRY